MIIGMGTLQDEFQLSGEYQAFHGWLEKLEKAEIVFKCFSPKGHHLRGFDFIRVKSGEFIVNKLFEVWEFIHEAQRIENQVDMIHIFLPTPSFLWIADRIKKKIKKPLFVTCLGEDAQNQGASWFRQIGRSFVFFSVRFLAPLLMPTAHFSADAYIVGNQMVAQQLLRRGCSPDKIRTLWPCLPSEGKPDQISQEIALAMESLPTFLYVGHFLPNKGVEILVEAFSKLSRARARLCLVWSGLGDLEKIRSLVRGFHLESDISIVERRVHLSTVFSKAAALVVPMTQSFGQVSPPIILIEAFRSGIPLLVSKFPSTEYIGKEGRSVFFINPFDVDDLRRKMDRVLNETLLMTTMREKQRSFYAEKMERIDLSQIYGRRI